MKAKSVAFVLYYPGSLKFHPSIVNSALILAAHSYQVDIFKPFNPDEGDIPSDAVHVIHGCQYRSNPLVRILSLRKLQLSMLKSGRGYTALFGIDAYGLLVASAARSKFRAPIIYFSLEILSRDMNAGDVRGKKLMRRLGYYAHHTLLKWIEKRHHKNVALTIIQDEIRWAVLRRVNSIDADAPVVFLPNSPCADKETLEHSDYLRQKYSIPSDRIIVLYAGSLGVWTGINRIVEFVQTWPEKFVLVLHGRGMPQFMNYLRERVADSQGRIILSLDQLAEDEYEEMLRSADIGLAWYADRDDPNTYYISAGSGKLFYYLKHGLPVVTNRFPGLPEIVEAHDAGICIEHEAGIGDGLVKIEQEHNHYSRNARARFADYEFSSRFSKVLAFIQAKSPQKT